VFAPTNRAVQERVVGTIDVVIQRGVGTIDVVIQWWRGAT